MTSFKVKVKWGKETYPDIEVDTAEPPEVFRAQVFALTGVHPDRQKILLKGTTIKSDSWEGAKLKNGALIVIMGSREEDVLKEDSTVKPVFVEDLTDEQNNVIFDMPVGLKNLGNTCYLNAVLQCIITVPELHNAILEFDAAAENKVSDSNLLLVAALKTTFNEMCLGNTPMPIVLVEVFRRAFPRFAEQSSQGGYMQQDANECWTELLLLLQDTLPCDAKSGTKQLFSSSLVQKYMSGGMESVWTCVEDGGDPPSTTQTTFHQLSCHISTDVKYLHTGLLSRLTEQITKNSPSLGRDAVYTKKSLITRLPAYLTIDMVRFYYKEKEAVNAKILKDVKFPLILDVFELCTPDLQKRMIPFREHYKDMEDREKEESRALKMGKPIAEKDKPKLKTIPYYFEDDLGSCNSGFYKLQAVLTHQGRTSSSGHYVAWVRYKDHWLKCDDDEITPVTEEEILRLSGGGDWHCAYVMLYGPRPLTVPEDVSITPAEGEPMEASTSGTAAEKMES